MDIGIPKEIQSNEYRVGLTPQGVHLLVQEGHRCYVETGAGDGAGFRDTDYERAGARITYTAEEVYSRADLVLKVARFRAMGTITTWPCDQRWPLFWIE